MDLALNWSFSASIHGVFHSLNAEKRYSARIVWISLVSIFVVICSCLQFSLFYTFLIARPNVVELSFDRETSLNFPNIVICDLNQENDKLIGLLDLVHSGSGHISRFLTQLAVNELFESIRWSLRTNISQTLEEHPKLDELYNLYYSGIDHSKSIDFLGYKPSLEATLSSYVNMVLTDADRDNEVKWQEYFLFNSGMAATLQSLVKFCQWKGQDCLDLGSWKQVWTLNVLCWEFTPHERRVQIPDDKLTMIFDLETEEGIPFLHIAGGLALQVFLYDPTRTILSTWDKSYSFNVAPGYSYRASLSLEEFHDDSGRSDCIQEGAKGILKYHDDGYTHMTCVSECFADKELETCGCNSVGVYFMPKNITVPCDGVTMVMCPFHQANAMESCMQACRPQCSFNKYHATNTMTKFPSINAAKSLKKITKLSNRVPSNGTISEYHCDMRQNYAELQVSIGSFLVRRTRIMPKYNFAKATSAMGGLFGLLLGGSMLSVYEIFELLLQLFCRFVKNILNKIGNKVGKKVQSDDDIPCID